MNEADLITLLRTDLNDGSSTYWSDAQYQRAIADAVRAIANKQPTLNKYVLTTTAGTAWYDLDGLFDWQYIHGCFVYSSSGDQIADYQLIPFEMRGSEIGFSPGYQGYDISIEYAEVLEAADLDDFHIQAVRIYVTYLFAKYRMTHERLESNGLEWKRGQVSVKNSGQSKSILMEDSLKQFNDLFETGVAVNVDSIIPEEYTTSVEPIPNVDYKSDEG